MRTRRDGRGAPGRARRWLIVGLVVFLVFGMISSVPMFLPSFRSGSVPANAGAGAALANGGGTLANAEPMRQALVAAGVPEEHADAFVATAGLGIDPRLVAAVAWQESRFAPDVVACQRGSRAGAQGIMQFMPGTASERNVDPCRPGDAIAAGARYLVEIYGRFNSWDLALAGYNAGPNGKVDSCKCVPQNGETERYVAAVNGKWEEYKRTVPEPRFEGGLATGADPGVPLGSVEPYAEPNITANMQALLDQAVPLFGRGHGIGCYDPSRPSGEHPLGRACDFLMSSPLNTQPSPEYLEHGWRFACWMVQNAEALYVRYVIWQKQIWESHHNSAPDRRCNANRSGEGWTEYTRYDSGGNLTLQHYDHVHVTVN